MALQSRCQLLSRYLVEKIVRTRNLPDWFLMVQLSHNMDDMNFKRLCQIILKESGSIDLKDDDEKRCFRQCQPADPGPKKEIEFEKLNELNLAP